jgi:hypothetical protein
MNFLAQFGAKKYVPPSGGSYLPPIARYVYLVNDASDQTRMGGTGNNVYITAKSAYDAAVVIQTALGGTNKVAIVIGETLSATVGGITLTANWNSNIILCGYGTTVSVIGTIVGDNNGGNAYTINTQILNCTVGNLSTAATGATGNGGSITLTGNGTVGTISTIASTTAAGNGGAVNLTGITASTITTTGGTNAGAASGNVTCVRCTVTTINVSGAASTGSCGSVALSNTQHGTISQEHFGSVTGKLITIYGCYTSGSLTRSNYGSAALSTLTIRNCYFGGTITFNSNGVTSIFPSGSTLYMCTMSALTFVLNGSGSISSSALSLYISNCNINVLSFGNTNTNNAVYSFCTFNSCAINTINSLNIDTNSSTWRFNNCSILAIDLVATNSTLLIATPDILNIKGGSLNTFTVTNPNGTWSNSSFDNISCEQDMLQIDTDYTATLIDNCIMCDTSLNPITVTLPEATTCKNKKYLIKKIIANTDPVYVDSVSYIGLAQIRVLSQIGDVLAVISDGASWQVMSEIITSVVNTNSVGNVGGGESDLITIDQAAYTLASDGDYVTIDAYGTVTNTASAKYIRMYFGSSEILGKNAAGGTASGWYISAIVNRIDSTNQIAQGSVNTVGNTQGGTNYTTPAEDLTSAVTIKCTGNATNNNDIIQNCMILRVYRQ